MESDEKYIFTAPHISTRAFKKFFLFPSLPISLIATIFALFAFLGQFLFINKTLIICAVIAAFSLVFSIGTLILWWSRRKENILWVESMFDLPYLSLILIAIHTIAYVYLIDEGGMKSQLWKRVWEEPHGSLYRVYVCALLNFPPPDKPNHTHLLGNMAMIFFHGSFLEITMGRLGMILIWLLAPWTELWFNRTMVLGTSIITFGFLGALLAYTLIIRIPDLYYTLDHIAGKIRHLAISFLLASLPIAIGMPNKEEIGHFTHARALMFGFTFALLIAPVTLINKPERKSKFIHIISRIFFPPTLMLLRDGLNDEPERARIIRKRKTKTWILCWTFIGVIGFFTLCLCGMLTKFYVNK